MWLGKLTAVDNIYMNLMGGLARKPQHKQTDSSFKKLSFSFHKQSLNATLIPYTHQHILEILQPIYLFIYFIYLFISLFIN